jgi:hypothetical protein
MPAIDDTCVIPAQNQLWIQKEDHDASPHPLKELHFIVFHFWEGGTGEGNKYWFHGVS